MNNSGYSKILNLKYKIIEYSDKKPSCLIFEDNVVYKKEELAMVFQMDDETKIITHRIKKIYDSMILSLNQIL